MKLSKIIARAEKLGKHWSLTVEKDGVPQFRADTTEGNAFPNASAFEEVLELDPAALDALDKARPYYGLEMKGWTAALSLQIGDTLFFDHRRYILPAKRCEIGF